MTTSLDHLRNTGTVVVTDTGEFESIAQFKPQDATTNPSLILAAAKKTEYARLIDRAVEATLSAHGGRRGLSPEAAASETLDRLLVEFGVEILKIIPGRVSTEVDARLSFDRERTVKKALELISLYEKKGIGRDRVLIKIAATWEGIQAARELEAVYGVHCNLTLLFAFAQAVACAEARVTLISPFVGRILDWHRDKTGKEYASAADPGVVSVKRIFHYYKRYGYETIVMGASFRSVGEIEELAGCDFLTISPSLLEKLVKSTASVEKKLDARRSVSECADRRVSLVDNESRFRFELNEDQMATEKLSDGIRKFSKDTAELVEYLKRRIGEAAKL